MTAKRLRYVTLLFISGIMWGYLAKSLADKRLYIGHDDAQAYDALGVYKIKRLQRQTEQESLPGDTQDYVAPESTPGTIGI